MVFLRLFLALFAFFLITESRGEKEEQTALAEIENFLRTEVDEGKIAGGTVLILHRGEPVYHVAAGYADLESGRLFSVDDRVVVASISKPLLATALFRLSDAGKLDLELPITHYLPEFSEAKLVNGEGLERGPKTLELISHSGGALSFYSEGGRPWFASWTREVTLAEVAKGYADRAIFESVPGARYAYSGIGTDIAARVGEVAAGQLRNEYFLAEVAGPLGMKDTAFRETGSRSEEMPTRYLKDEETGKLRKSKPRPMPKAGEYSSSGGAIISTADDLAIWLKMVRDGGNHRDSVYLSPPTMEAFLKPSPLGQTTGGGFHIRRRDEEGGLALIGHSGSSGTDCWIDFENDLIGIVLTQSGSKTAKPLHDKVRELALKWAAESSQSRPAR